MLLLLKKNTIYYYYYYYYYYLFRWLLLGLYQDLRREVLWVQHQRSENVLQFIYWLISYCLTVKGTDKMELAVLYTSIK